MSDVAEPVRIEVTLPARFDTVWQAFRVPEAIRRWHGWEYDGLDAEIRCIYEEETTASQPDRALEIGGHLFALEDGGDEVVVRVTRSLAAAGSWTEYYDEIEQGWLAFLQQLRFALARHPGEDRRTVRLEGQALAPKPLPVVDTLGLTAAASVKVGKRYEAIAAWGEELAGELWFRERDQLGFTVDGWGDGLLVVTSSRSAPGVAAVTATTYGFDEEALAGLHERMDALWSAAYGSLDQPELA